MTKDTTIPAREVNPMGYTITTESHRITALDHDGRAICGAFQPEGHDYWSLYVTRLVTEATGLTTPPHREHFWNDHGGNIVARWVELVAALYCLAMQQDRCAYPQEAPTMPTETEETWVDPFTYENTRKKPLHINGHPYWNGKP